MHYEGAIIRPPSEADSILLQVTVGCSHNKCTFCGAYKQKRFRIKSEEEVSEDIAYAARHFPDSRRLFLCDGDALILPQERLRTLLQQIHAELPRVFRVTSYANAKCIARKSLDELRELRGLGLAVIHMGVESGDDLTLRAVGKWGTSQDMVDQGTKVRQAGMKLFVTVLLGLAGPERSLIHARETGRVLSSIDPEYAGALSLMPVPGTALFQDIEAGRFSLLSPEQMLRELREMVVHTTLTHGQFYANHASNYLPIAARFPKEKEETLHLIDQALAGGVPLVPEWMRGL